MNIIFHFADLEVSDLSQLNNKYAEASPEAQSAIDYTIDTLTSWHADIIAEDMKKLPNEEKEKIFAVIKDTIHTQ